MVLDNVGARDHIRTHISTIIYYFSRELLESSEKRKHKEGLSSVTVTILSQVDAGNSWQLRGLVWNLS
jgi:hypothetical protein